MPCIMQCANMVMQVRKGRREIELGREGVEDDRRRLQSKEARLAELAADSQEKHQTISLYVPSCTKEKKENRKILRLSVSILASISVLFKVLYRAA